MRRSDENQMLTELAANDGLTAWEQEFVESLADQIDRGALLTDKQRRKLADIYEERVLGY